MWNQARMNFHPRNHGRNFFRPSLHGNTGFPNANYFPNWNPGYMGVNEFNPGNFQFNFRPNTRPPLKMRHQHWNSYNGPRRHDRNDEDCSSLWTMQQKDCFGDSSRLNPRTTPRRSRGRSPSPSCSRSFSRENKFNENFRNRFDDRYSSPYTRKPSSLESAEERISPSFKRTIFPDNKRDRMKMTWSSDSDSESKAPPMKPASPKQKTISNEDKNLISLIWSGQAGEEEDKSTKQKQIFKYSFETLPKFDGKTVVGDEGVFEMKVYRCTFCNMICLDKEKSKEHMLTKYHYNNYKDYMINYDMKKTSEKNN